jgi:hypothetical protein
MTFRLDMSVFDNQVCERVKAYINNFNSEYAVDDNVPTPINRIDIDPTIYSTISYYMASQYMQKYCNNRSVGGRIRRSKQQRKSRSKQQRRRSKQQYYKH